ncbi:electron transport complex subunit RsxG [Flocculibacter collagenilyticus]|uniref:electron transport complex subunit RsxG n=1 Tax=Flocculibacter collagenilyticus TaxID=2744479 RepID=UPI0018F2E160|nr:electron transport complex subunit RsxG [Flocculibacter collagenilyticus]
MTKSMQKNGLLLAIFAVICTGLVAITHTLTKDRIAAQQQSELQKSITDVVSKDLYNNNLFDDCISVTSPEFLGNDQIKQVYRGRVNGEPAVLAIESTAPNGYSGSIELLTGFNINNEITGVRVINHKETPGLGDKVEIKKSDWITSFNGLKVEGEDDTRWAVRKDGGMFDQFTGATITPRAVVTAVKNTALYYQNNKKALFAPTQQNCRGELNERD